MTNIVMKLCGNACVAKAYRHEIFCNYFNFMQYQEVKTKLLGLTL